MSHVKTLYVAGRGLRGSGYPNAENTLHALAHHGFRIIELGDWYPEDTRLWSLGKNTKLQLASWLFSTLLASIRSLWRAMRAQRKEPAPVYIPYPSIFLLSAASFIPKRWRPDFIADAYISIWDSRFRDRANKPHNNLSSKLTHFIERRALHTARCILVDTEANRSMMINEFGLMPERVLSIPLAIPDIQPAQSPPSQSHHNTITVLFVGTLVPLHGIENLIGAMQHLSNTPEIQFRIIGDGQQRDALEAFMRSPDAKHCHWERNWQSFEQITEAIHQADICLGIFGGDGKAARVLPFKIYLYLAAGKPVISQSNLSTPNNAPSPPMIGLAHTTPETLATAIQHLASNASHRQALAQQAQAYFTNFLSSAQIKKIWADTILKNQRKITTTP